MDTILEQIKFTLLQEPRWRQPIYGAWGDDVARATTHHEIENLLQELTQITTRLTPDQVVQSGATLNYRVTQVDEHTRFQVIPTARVECQSQAGGMHQVKILNEDLTRGTRETLDMAVNEPTARMIKWIASQGEPFYPNQITAHFDCLLPDVIDLLKTLCQGELLMPLWFDPIHQN